MYVCVCKCFFHCLTDEHQFPKWPAFKKSVRVDDRRVSVVGVFLCVLLVEKWGFTVFSLHCGFLTLTPERVKLHGSLCKWAGTGSQAQCLQPQKLFSTSSLREMLGAGSRIPDRTSGYSN